MRISDAIITVSEYEACTVTQRSAWPDKPRCRGWGITPKVKRRYHSDVVVITGTKQENIKALESQHALQISSVRNNSLPKRKHQWIHTSTCRMKSLTLLAVMLCCCFLRGQAMHLTRPRPKPLDSSVTWNDLFTMTKHVRIVDSAAMLPIFYIHERSTILEIYNFVYWKYNVAYNIYAY